MKKLLCVGIILCAVFFLEQTHMCFGGNSTSGICIEGEREALLKLKRSFEDPSNRLASWSREDCCAWSGVSCDKSTGRVVHLDLSAPINYIMTPSGVLYQRPAEAVDSLGHQPLILEGPTFKMSSSLANLKHLEFLDLSGNYFNQSQIPDFFGSFKYLTYLNISFAGFGGKITRQLGNLTKLKVIDMSYNYGIYADDFQWASSHSSLQILDMTHVNLSKALDLIPTLTKLPSLLQLELNHCQIQNIHFPDNSTFLATIQSLGLTGNKLGGEISKAIQNMTALRKLDLGYQEWSFLDGLPHFNNLQWASSLLSLQHLDMSGINLEKALDLMPILSKLPSLLQLQLNRCGIRNVHFSVGLINSTFLANVQSLGLSGNKLSGEIPNVIRNMTALRQLDLGYQEGYFVSGGLRSENMQWISSFSSLQHFDMTGTDFAKAYDLFEALIKLPSLLDLWLNFCGIKTIHVSQATANSTFFSRLQHLNLRDNDISGPIPDALKNMTELIELDLSGNRFNSTVPLRLVASKSLVSLDIAWNKFDSIEGGLSSMVNSACSLKSLYLSSNPLGSSVFGNNRNSSWCMSYSLEVLNVRNTSATGNIPKWLGKLASLIQLDLGYNLLSGSIPSLVGGLPLLRSLDLSNNQLTGTIPQSITRLSVLVSLDISNNRIDGAIPLSLGRLSTLQYLDFSNNKLNGTLPVSFGRLSNLRELVLSDNHLSGLALDHFGQLTNLYKLDISSNPFQGVISELHFANIQMLEILSISSTNLTWKVKSNWIPPFSLYNLNMSSCKIGPEFPQWLQTQQGLYWMDLSNGGILGSFPRWFHSTYLGYFDLSMNQISGDSLPRIFEAIPEIDTLLLGDNLISGSIPNSLCKLEYMRVLDVSRNNISGEIPNCFRESQRLNIINLSVNRLFGKIPDSLGQLPFLKRFFVNQNSLDGVVPQALGNCKDLELLDLGENKFSGSIPPWLGESFPSLRILRLHKNMLIDIIPPQLCKLSNLQILDLSENNLIGKIPRCLGKLRGMSIQGNITKSKYPTIPGPPSKNPDEEWRRVKVVESTKGLDNLEFTKTQLQLLDLLDLSNNKLVGAIPEELCLLHGLRSLKLSHNLLSERIPKKIGDLKLLDTLDLSDNKLSGEIPQSMSLLPYISHLNLSNNNFSGRIPQGNQLQTLIDPSIYAGNVELCGDPLPKKCPDHNDHSAQHQRDEDHEDGAKEKIWFWFVVIAGYAAGFWAVIGTFVFKRNWRIAYFRFVDETKEKLLLMVAVKVAMLKKGNE